MAKKIYEEEKMDIDDPPSLTNLYVPLPGGQSSTNSSWVHLEKQCVTSGVGIHVH